MPAQRNDNLEDPALRNYRMDTHIHTCLSPCGDWGMGPMNIAAASRKTGLDVIAVCDHNSAENAEAVMRAGAAAGITVIPGMEICSKEEVHIVALFETVALARRMEAFVYAHLPGENRPEVFGEQVVANEYDEVTGENRRLLIGATALTLKTLVTRIHQIGGVCIAAHVDRPAFGILGSLGFIPPDLAIDAVEVSFRVPLKQARESVSGIGDYPCITASDAHFINDIGRAWFEAKMAAPSLSELRLALNNTAGRRIVMH